MAGERSLLIKFLGDASSLKNATADADAATATFSGNMKNLAGTIGSTYAAAKVIEFGKASVEAAAADEAAQVTLATALRNTAGATDAQIAAAEEWITQTMFATGVADDELRPALERLTRATGDVGQAQDLLKVAMDASAGTGKSLQAVSDALGKAADGNVGALGRLGIATKDASGETLSFDQIVQNLNSTFSGQAAAAADTQAGKMAIMKARMAELQEEIGTALMPIMEQLVGVLGGVAEWFSSLDKDTQKWIVRIGMLGGGLVLATRAVNGILGPLKSLGIIGKATGTSLDGVTAATGRMGRAATAAATTLGAAAIAFTAWEMLGAVAAESMAKLEENALSLSTVVDEDLNTAFMAAAAASLGSARNTDSTTESIEKMVVANIEGSRRLLEYRDANGMAGELTEALRQSIIKVEAEMARSAATAAEYAGDVTEVGGSTKALGDLMTGPLTSALDRAATATKGLGDLMVGPLKAAIDDTTTSTKSMTDLYLTPYRNAMAAITEAIKARQQAEEDLYNELQSQLEGQYDFEQNLRDMKTALEEYNAELAEGKMTSDEAATATAELGAKARAVALDFARSQGAADGSRESIDLQIQSLGGLASTLAPDSPLRVELLRYIANLQAIPVKVDTELSADTSKADAAIDKLLARLRLLDVWNPLIPMVGGGSGGTPPPTYNDPALMFSKSAAMSWIPFAPGGSPVRSPFDGGEPAWDARDPDARRRGGEININIDLSHVLVPDPELPQGIARAVSSALRTLERSRQ